MTFYAVLGVRLVGLNSRLITVVTILYSCSLIYPVKGLMMLHNDGDAHFQ